jgi:hypothetical protein
MHSFEVLFKGGTIDSLLGAMSSSAKCSEREALECILRSFL